MDRLAELEATRDQDREEPATKQALALSRFTGIGPTSAHVLVGEVFHREFGNRRELAASFGLAPSHHSSGTVHRDQGIAKSGNARARRVAVEVAWLWLRFQPGSTLSRWFHERSGAGRGRMRRVLIVALARKLMIALWRSLAIGIVPEGALLKS
jgi:transposase